MIAPGKAFSERLLRVAIVAEAWPTVPRLAHLTDMACDLDGMSRSLARMLGGQSPGTPVQSATDSARQLHGIAKTWAQRTPDAHSIEACNRLALNLFAALTALNSTEQDDTQ